MQRLKFYGTGGQGVVTAANIFSAAVSLIEGNYAITIPAYGHERRGAPVNTSIIVDSEPVLLNCFVYEPDIVVVLDPSVEEKGVDPATGIHGETLLILNTGEAETAQRWNAKGFAQTYYADATHIGMQHTGKGIPNGAMLGLLAAAGIVSPIAIEQSLLNAFGEKAGVDNANAAKQAYHTAKICSVPWPGGD